MKTVQFREAICEAMSEEMRRDESVYLMGEEVAEYNGAYKASKGMLDEFGELRVIDTPISEAGFSGVGVGSTMVGARPIIEFMTFNFSLVGIDQIINNAAKIRQMSGGQFPCPIVFRGPTASAGQLGATHSQAFESWFANCPGLKVIVPSNPYDAKGLLVAAVNDPNPVMYLEHKKLYRKPDIKMDVPLGLYEVEIGKGKIVKEGSDISIVTWSGMVSVAEQAAQELEKEGISVEIVDIRTIFPLDEEIILQSVEKTSNLCVLQEDVPFSSVASEISSMVAEKGFWNLDNPIVKVTPPNTHIPFAPVLEDAFIPSAEKVIKAIKELQ